MSPGIGHHGAAIITITVSSQQIQQVNYNEIYLTVSEDMEEKCENATGHLA
jgi:hypothetical protein